MPGPDVFERPPSPRPASPSLSPSWHDNEVNYMTSAAPSHIHEASGSNWPSQEPPSDAHSGQSQSLDVPQVPTLNANDAREAVVDKYEKKMYTCNTVPGNLRIHVPDGAWIGCYINISQHLYPGYLWTADSGRQYYTWSLEPEWKANKKRH